MTIVVIHLISYFIKKNPITIKITDKNYKGIPIEKGKITLSEQE